VTTAALLGTPPLAGRLHTSPADADGVATAPASARSDRRRPTVDPPPRQGPQRTDREETRAVSLKMTTSAGPRDELLTVPQFCEEVGVEKSTYYRWRQLGRGPRTFKLPNGQVRIRRSALETWLEELEGAAR